ncbi:ankyrin repeat protein [Aspergillus lucknowensis]|uniref:Ankyrin repeat protein n=1 Tax=Aspergillus lucknowensis TaxID=176173 RepID=A0ABR4LNE7_9EURO
MPPRTNRLQHEDYTIGWISPLPIERAAAEAMLDEIHAVPNGFSTNETDTNIYIWGCIGEHNLVIASLAPDVYKLVYKVATVTLLSLVASLPSIRFWLWVGIGSGIARPDKGWDIRLGDIVVGQPRGTVCHYDLVKASMGDECVQKSFIGLPPGLFLSALTRIKAAHEQKGSKVPIFLQEMLMKNPQMRKTPNQDPGYTHQGFENDRLFNASCDHIPGPDCGGCDVGSEVQRGPRDKTRPEIHYGIIASGNTPVKDAATRDRIVAEVGDDCICMETEAGTLISNFPCLMIRGICDYADSHKNDQWQRYASATAAAYAKELLAYIPAAEVAREIPIPG